MSPWTPCATGCSGQQRRIERYGERHKERVAGRACTAQLPRPSQQMNIRMAADTELREIDATALHGREVDLGAAQKATERLGHLDVHETGRVDVTEHPAALGFGGLTEQLGDDA